MPFIPSHISVSVMSLFLFYASGSANEYVSYVFFFFPSAGERDSTASNGDKLVSFYALE